MAHVGHDKNINNITIQYKNNKALLYKNLYYILEMHLYIQVLHVPVTAFSKYPVNEKFKYEQNCLTHFFNISFFLISI